MTLGMPRRLLRCALGAGAAALVAAGGTSVASAVEAPAAVVPPVEARLATFNIHAGTGSDNVYDLDRTAAAIAALDADVVGLEEADVHWGDRSDWQDSVAELARRLGMQSAFAPIYDLYPLAEGAPRRQYGVALLSRHPIVAVENHDLTRLSTQVPSPVPAPAPGFLEATAARMSTSPTWTIAATPPCGPCRCGTRSGSSARTRRGPTRCSSVTSTPGRGRPSCSPCGAPYRTRGRSLPSVPAPLA